MVMTKMLVWDSREDCNVGLSLINANIRAMATEAGYELDENGSIIGKDGNGVDQPDAQATVTWDVPHIDDVNLSWWTTDPATRYEGEELARVMAGVTNYYPAEYEFQPDPEE